MLHTKFVAFTQKRYFSNFKYFYKIIAESDMTMTNRLRETTPTRIQHTIRQLTCSRQMRTCRRMKNLGTDQSGSLR